MACHVDERRSILCSGQTTFKMETSVSQPMNLSTWILVEAMAKFDATPEWENWSLSFWAGLFNYTFFLLSSKLFCLHFRFIAVAFEINFHHKMINVIPFYNFLLFLQWQIPNNISLYTYTWKTNGSVPPHTYILGSTSIPKVWGWVSLCTTRYDFDSFRTMFSSENISWIFICWNVSPSWIPFTKWRDNQISTWLIYW